MWPTFSILVQYMYMVRAGHQDIWLQRKRAPQETKTAKTCIVMPLLTVKLEFYIRVVKKSDTKIFFQTPQTMYYFHNRSCLNLKLSSFGLYYSCNKITKTWIQISRQNRNVFFSNISHQGWFNYLQYFLDTKPSSINTKKKN